MSSRNNAGSAPHGGQGKKPSKSQIQKQQAAKRAMAAASGAKAARNKRLMQVGVPVLVVIVVVGILIAVSATRGKKGPNATNQANQTVTSAVTGVPASVLDKVGAGSATGPSQLLTGSALTENGKPKVLYVGAEWCPYCAAERWALAQALSRFGTLTNLGQTASDPNDTDPNTPTLSFHGANFTSDTIALTAAEIEDNNHKPFDKLSSSDDKLFTTIGKSSFPFIDIGGKYQFGVQYDPAILAGKTHAQIADAMSDPSSDIGKAIDGSANVLTAAICQVTNGQPTNVCTAKGVTASTSTLTNANK
jgi:thiol-disulfide isomerase/thioredoxin